MTGGRAVEAAARLDRMLRAGIDGAAAILLAAVTTLGIAQVVWRYGLNASLTWSEEAIRLLFVWLVLAGAATASHMRVTLIADLAGPRLSLMLRLVRHAVVLWVLAVLVQGAVSINALFGSDRFVTLGLTRSWYWTGAVVGALLWMGTIVSDLVLALLRGRPG
jgi:TRAP-type C4-dicarboxylate transport system permease small subunit